VCDPLEVLRWVMEHGAPFNLARLKWYEHLLRGEPNAMDVERLYAGRGV
jgi:hypothetical protein